MTVQHAPRPPILDAIDPLRHTVLEASAGTGKTYTLEHLVVELVLVHGVPLEQILVVTFTDKATREMRERVRVALRTALDAPSEPTGPSWVVDEAGRRRLGDALALFDRAPISTIHAFCQRVLSESAFDCARLLRQEQVESREVFGRAFREELRVSLAPGAEYGPVLERAIALFGTERLEKNLYQWYVERGEPEPRFDRARAEDALRRLPTRLELAPSGFVAQALARSLSRQPKKTVPRLLLELAPTIEVLRAGGSVYDALLDFWRWAERDAPGRRTQLGYVRHYLGRARGIGPLAEAVEELGRTAGSPLSVLVRELLPRIVARLMGQKAERGWFDFDDMLRVLREALHAPGGGALVSDLRRRYRVALVDEFQDTDRVQWDIFSKVFFEAGEERTLILIGDPKQAIYGFRNADVHTYHAAKEAVTAGGGHVVPLTVQYRSRAPVIDAVNRILAEGFFTGVNAYPHPVTCGRPQLSAIDDAGTEAPAVTLLHLVGRPALRAGLVRRALGAWVAAEIQRLLAGGLLVDRGEGAVGIVASDVHVLCRSSRDADAVAEALAAARIPHSRYRQEGLFQTEAARDVWVLLRAIEDPDARGKRLDAWLTPFFAVPLERIEDCRDLPPEHPLKTLLVRWRQMAEGQRWATLSRSLLEDSGLMRRELFASLGERRLTDYQHILEILLEETHRGRRSLPQLVARLGAFIEGRELPAGESGNVHRLESERRAVQVLTMHKSKGLEAEVVFLAGGLSEPNADRLAPRVFHDDEGQRLAWVGDPPTEIRARMDRERREEAERLLYVALTRARSRLYLPYFGPPPPGVAPASDASYELEAGAPEPGEEEAQLTLHLEAPEAIERASTSDERDPEYELERMHGPYRVLNERLAALVADGVTEDPSSGFEHMEVSVEPRRRAQSDASGRLAGWRPPEALEPGPGADDASFDRLRERHGGFGITSYTRMKSAVGGYRAPPEAEGAADEALLAAAVDAALPSEDELPGGTAMGVFLHEALEHVPFERIREVPDGDALLADDDLRAIVAARARANGIDERWLPAAARLLVSALRAPLTLADGASLASGLCAVERRVAELRFLHPIPERDHPRLDQAPPGPDRPTLSVERGFVRGVVDLVLEHEGRYHVVDYKSDRLPSFAPERVAAHVTQNYLVQARLYAIGTLRALAIHDEESYERRFGGLLYVFLRGMMEPGHGVWTLRPSFDEVLAWERALLSDRPWGYPLPVRRGG